MSPARPPVGDMSVPTLDRLRADLGQTYWLTLPSGERIAGEVRAARAGVPMNEQHCCYSAQLALPPGVQLPQAVYEVHAEADAWHLLLVPVRPGADGRAVLEAVFHYPLPQASAGQSHA
jgi:hypothetical protein